LPAKRLTLGNKTPGFSKKPGFCARLLNRQRQASLSENAYRETAALLNRAALPLLALLALSAGAATAQPDSRAPAPAPPPPVTEVLPDDVAAVLLINTTAEAWGRLNRFNPLPIEFTGPGRLPLLPPGINFTADVQPWVGEWAALAVLGPPADALIPCKGACTLMLVPVKDAGGMKAFVAKLQENQGEAPVERDYKGVKILEWAAPQSLPDSESPETVPDLPEESPPAPEPAPDSRAGLSGDLGFGIWDLGFKNRASRASQPADKILPVTTFSQRLPVAVKSPLPAEPAEPEQPPKSVSQQGLALAILPEYVATSTSGEALEQLIDRLPKGKKPLAETAGFKRTLEQPQFSRSLFVGYSNLAKAARVNFTDLPELPGGLSLPVAPLQLIAPALQQIAETYDTVQVFVGVRAEGLHSQAQVYYKIPQPQKVPVGTPDGEPMANRLPAATYLSFSSRNLKQQWNQIAGAGGEEAKPLFEGLRRFIRNITGLNLEEDILSWMNGEYALFVFPANQGFFPFLAEQFKIGVGFTVRTRDRPAAEKMLDKLNEFVGTSSGGSLAITSRQLGAQPVSSWEIQQAGGARSIFAHGWADGNTLILTSGTGPMSALIPQPNPPLGKTYIFQTATASLPYPNDGNIYLNCGAVLSFVYSVLPLDDSSEFVRLTKRLLGSLRSLSAVSSSTAEKQQADVLLVLAPVRER
jgi:hypothetical protein